MGTKVFSIRGRVGKVLVSRWQKATGTVQSSV